jgi:hypothetical protein
MRDDNLPITEDGRVLVCDWNWLTLAAPGWTWLVCSSAFTVTDWML